MTQSLRLLFNDLLGSPLGTLHNGDRQLIAYTPYGYRRSETLATSLGFTGRLRERSFGWYLLGNGHRAYNPVLMRFHSADGLSPFGRGGLNAYAYCSGDPVNRSDATGRFGELARVRRNSLSSGSNISSPASTISASDATDFAIQGIYGLNSTLSAISTVVGRMEANQNPTPANQSQAARAADIGNFYSAVASYGTRGASIQQMLNSPTVGAVQLASGFSLTSGLFGTMGYATLPRRIQRVWQDAGGERPSFVQAAGWALAQVSGLDVPWSYVDNMISWIRRQPEGRDEASTEIEETRL